MLRPQSTDAVFLHLKNSRLTGQMWTRHLQKVVHDRCPTFLRWDPDADHDFKMYFNDIYKDIGGIAKTLQQFPACQLDTVYLCESAPFVKVNSETEGLQI